MSYLGKLAERERLHIIIVIKFVILIELLNAVFFDDLTDSKYYCKTFYFQITTKCTITNTSNITNDI